MLELFGKDYIIQHCGSVLRTRQRNELYRVYVTEALRAVAKGVGYELQSSYADLLDAFEPVRESRTSEDIISDIQTKIVALG